MKNAALIKVSFILAVLVIVILGVVGHIMRRDKKDLAPEEGSKIKRIEVKKVTEATEENTIEYTIKAYLPEEFPKEEPDPEIVGGSTTIYFTNMKEIDESNVFPLTAWEKLTYQTQQFLNSNGISVSEIRAVSGSLKNESGKMSFETELPELPGRQLRIIYDLGAQKFLFEVDIPLVIE